MNVKRLVLTALVFCFLVSGISYSSGDDTPGLFPEIQGWKKDGAPEIYYADNLWEYINGAAEIYLSYEFQKVATLTYEGDEKRSLTVDIYEHSDPRNAFGIYSQEKPINGDFLPIGVQGYYDKGILNFFQGSYYVKMMGYYIEKDEESFLESIGNMVSEKLGGEHQFPKALACFPEKNKIENSERYIARDFLGRSYLHSAFTAVYELNEKETRMFIIEAAHAKEADEMLERYLQFAKEKSSGVTEEKGIYRFEDPYLRSSGKMNLKGRDRYIWGILCDDVSTANSYIGKIEKNLESNDLIGEE